MPLKSIVWFCVVVTIIPDRNNWERKGFWWLMVSGIPVHHSEGSVGAFMMVMMQSNVMLAFHISV